MTVSYDNTMYKSDKHETSESKGVIIVDLDDTLFENTIISRTLQRISIFTHRLSFRFQRKNSNITKNIGSATVIILTSRSDKSHYEATINQLNKSGIVYSQLIMFPEDKIKDWWKKRCSDVIHHDIWYDDRKEQITNAIDPIVEITDSKSK